MFRVLTSGFVFIVQFDVRGSFRCAAWKELRTCKRCKYAGTAYRISPHADSLTFLGGIVRAFVVRMGDGVQRFTDLRAWQACVVYKKAVYRLCEREPIAKDWKRRGQLEDSVWGPPGHIAEGFGRFSPLDFARFVVMGRASLIESQNHLIDFVDRGYITEEQRQELHALAEKALEEVTGLIEYLQSPEAARNAQRVRERRLASRAKRRTPHAELNIEPRTRTRK